MIDYDFVKRKKCKCTDLSIKAFSKELKKLRTIVSPYLDFDVELEDMSVVRFGTEKKFFVAYPISALGCVKFSNVTKNYSNESGWKGTAVFMDGKIRRTVNFSIYKSNMYLRRS